MDRLQLSPSQEGIYFACSASSNPMLYIITKEYQLSSHLDTQILQESINAIVKRHASLRTSFHFDVDGPYQYIHASLRKKINDNKIQLHEPGLFSVLLTDLDNNQQKISFNFHHLIYDADSHAVFMKELSEVYLSLSNNKKPALPSLEVFYLDYIELTKTKNKTIALNNLAYWKECLSSVSDTINLPGRQSIENIYDIPSKNYQFTINSKIACELKKLSSDNNATLFITFFSLLSIVLSHYSQQDDFVIGTSVSDREEEGSEQLIGCLLNILPIPCMINHKRSLSEYLKLSSNNIFDALSHKDIALSDIVKAVNPERLGTQNPLFQVMFTYLHKEAEEKLDATELILLEPVSGPAKFDLTVEVELNKNDIKINLNYNPGLYETSLIEQLAKHYKHLLEHALEYQDCELSKIQFQSVKEIKELLGLGSLDYKKIPISDNISTVFEKIVDRYPNHLAIIHDDTKLTYSELNKNANKLARYLLNHGINQGDHIGLSLSKNSTLVTAQLAILKLGCAYVPIDPTSPVNRRNYIIKDSGILFMLTESWHKTQYDSSNVNQIALDTAELNRISEDNLNLSCSPQEIAYIIYTSGTTGKPKGVLTSQENLLRLFKSLESNFKFTSEQVWAMFHSYAFDFSVWELWGALLYGGCCVIIDDECARTPTEFSKALVDNKVSVLNQTPSAFYSLMPNLIHERDYVTESLDYIIFGGEALDCGKLTPWFNAYGYDKPALINMYGITETTVHVTFHQITELTQKNSIGRPLSDLVVYVLDNECRPCPIGMPGEIYVGGGGVAKGYLNNPTLTDEKFIKNPFSNEPSVLYKTGDLGKFDCTGAINYLGRIDNQIQLRGFRIELGEIESVLSKYQGVQQVAARVKNINNDSRLVAYLVLDKTTEFDATSIREYLSGYLPYYMLPNYFIPLEKLPMTVNGKLDEKALPVPDGELVKNKQDIKAVTEIEQEVVKICEDLLGVQEISLADNFFDLGGHSLLAIRLISLIRDTYGVEIPYRVIFKEQRLKAFSDYVQSQEINNKDTGKIKPVSRYIRLPLSPAQLSIYLACELPGSHSAYNMTFRYDLSERIDKTLLNKALNLLVQQHEILRTSFHKDKQGVYQQVHVESRNILNCYEKFNQKIDAQEIDYEFDFNQPGLIRVLLFDLDKGKQRLVINMHHLISDALSYKILLRELNQSYKILSSGERRSYSLLPIQYADYAYHTHKIFQLKSRQLREYWTGYLKDVPNVITLPIECARHKVTSNSATTLRCNLNTKLRENLNQYCLISKVSLFQLMIGLFSVVLGRYASTKDLVIGTTINDREHEGLYDLIGYFLNVVPIRFTIDSNLNLSDYIQSSSEQILDVWEHKSIPFGDIVASLKLERVANTNPIFQVIFTQLNNEADEESICGIPAKSCIANNATAKFDISLQTQIRSNGIDIELSYLSDLYDAELMESLLGCYHRLLENVVEWQNEKIKLLPYESMQNVKSLAALGKGSNVDVGEHNNIVSRFSENVKHYAAKNAASDIDGTLSYNELDARSNQLARYLQSKGIGIQARVGIAQSHSVNVLVSMLAVLKLGAIYVPMDINHPEARMCFMINDAEIKHVLTDSTHKVMFDGQEIAYHVCDELRLDMFETESIELSVDESYLAYVLYTSGTTGKPKGVCVTHKNILNYCTWLNDILSFEPEELFECSTSMGFDTTVSTTLFPLLYGHHILMVPKDIKASPTEFINFISNHGVTVLNTSPSAFSLLRHENHIDNLQTLSKIIIGGEALNAQDISYWLEERPELVFFNSYGPTECTVASVGYVINKDNYQKVFNNTYPIGKVCHNNMGLILDNNKQICPRGVVGELYISGESVSKGYLNQPELTQEKYINNPWQENRIMYATGDLVKYNSDGLLEYCGRNDNQIKLRGFRIELGEIESVLSKYQGVQQAVARVKNINNDSRLVAYLVLDKITEFDATPIREYLSGNLPYYMLPNYFIPLEKLPMTVNGKLDEKALPMPDGALLKNKQDVKAVTEIEQEVVRICEDLLGVQEIGLADNFFDLGGHSLLAIRLISMVKEKFNVDLPYRVIFKSQILSTFADYIDLNQQFDTEINGVVPVSREQRLPLAPSQLSIYLACELSNIHSAYNMTFCYRLPNKINKERLTQSFNMLLQRHEILRTSFHKDKAGVYQEVHTNLSKSIECYSEYEPSIYETESRYEFDFREPGLIRMILADVDSNEQMLIINMHHLISDALSCQLLLNELTTCYLCLEKNIIYQPYNLSIQYVDYALFASNLYENNTEMLASYWKLALCDVPQVIPLPTQCTRGDITKNEAEGLSFTLPKNKSEDLKVFAQSHKLTLFTVMLSLFSIVLSRYASTDDVVIGTTINDREQGSIQDLIGYFLNIIPIRFKVDDQLSVLEYIKWVNEMILDVWEHKEIPFGDIVKALQPERLEKANPLFQVMFTHLDSSRDKITICGELAELVKTPNIEAKFDLSITTVLTEEGIKVDFLYHTELYEKELMVQLLACYERLLGGVCKLPSYAKLASLDIVSKPIRNKLLNLGKGSIALVNNTDSLKSCIEMLSLKQPNKIALIHGTQQLTYSELNAYSNQLAHYLIEKKIRQGDFVGICIEHSFMMIISMLAIVKLGAAYVPIDSRFPLTRIEYIAKDANLNLVLSDKKTQDLFANVKLNCVITDEIDLTHYSDSNVSLNVNLSTIAYVIYTSGTTGQPKGVMISHGNLLNYFAWMNSQLDLSSSDIFECSTALSFDTTVKTHLFPLSSGCQVLLVDRATKENPQHYLKYLIDNRVTVMGTSPSAFSLLTPQETSLRYIIIGAEAIIASDVIKWIETCPELTFLNSYGPTEVTVACMGYLINKDNCKKTYNNTYPIGRVSSNNQVAVLDGNKNYCPLGVIGELYVAGASVAQSYLNKPELTQQKFTPTPWDDSKVMYATGDLVKYNADGLLEYCGRIDSQVKLRGFRIELGEIESKLLSHTAISQAAVLIKEINQDKKLIAYLVLQDDVELDMAALKSYLSTHLPTYMVPNYFMALDKLPMTINGKLDSNALPLPDITTLQNTNYLAPKSKAEKQLVSMCEELLGIEKIGLNANFFDIGGHSLFVLQLIAGMAEIFDKTISPREFMFNDLKKIAKLYDDAHNSFNPVQYNVIEKPIPYFFGNNTHLFGCYHEPVDTELKNIAVVLCYPFGQEYIRAHRAYGVISKELIQKGIPVLRFDFHGNGDSYGDFSELCINQAVSDINEAVIELKNRSGIDNIFLISARISANVAYEYANKNSEISGVVLWDKLSDSDLSIQEGFRYPDKFISQLNQLISTESTKMLSMEHLILESDGSIWESDPAQSLVPYQSIQSIIKWVVDLSAY